MVLDYRFMANTLIISTFQLSIKPILQLMGQMLHVVSLSFYRRGVHRKNKQEMIVIKESLSIKKRQISKETCQNNFGL
jgi:hypothetical protein